VPRWDQRVAEYWARGAAGARSEIVDALPAAHGLGSFVVPVRGSGGEGGAVTRTLCRYGTAGEIGWSTTFEPD
jgi:hypothetical protein